MTASDYFILNVQGVSAGIEDELAKLAFASGALGISEALGFVQPEGEEDVSTVIPEYRSLNIYFQTRPSENLLSELAARWPQLSVRVQGEVNRDWLEEWKKGFVPFALAENYWVVPSWCEVPKEAEHKIAIDPGMAFGTGTHATTQLVAAELIRISKLKPLNSCLDVGTGTGILAILAIQLGIEEVHATEIEEDSRRVAKENFALNQCANIRLDQRQLEDLSETYDLVMANIIDGVLVRIQSALLAKVKKGGWLVVSGIILEREPDFLSGFVLPSGRTWERRTLQGDWLAFSVQL